MPPHLISMLDVEESIQDILELAARIKQRPRKHAHALSGRSLAMIFEKPSTRTRVSFEVAMTQLGGHALHLSPKDLQLGRGETIQDTARVLSGYVDAIMYRAHSHGLMKELAGSSRVPVINALDDREHPCQILGDLLTMREYVRDIEGKKVAYVGDGNNVCNSLILGCALTGMDISTACPEGYAPDADILEESGRIASRTGSHIEVVDDPRAACSGADFIYTDVWVSMGDEKEKEQRERVFAPYQVNAELMEVSPRALFMHCLPAHRGLEVTDEVIDSDRSIVLAQAENRLHIQKGILCHFIRQV